MRLAAQATNIPDWSITYDVVLTKDGILPSSTNFLIVDFRLAVNYAANFSGSTGKALTAPSGDVVLSVRKNGTDAGSEIGTITVASDGSFTFATSGGSAVSFSIGDYLVVTTPSDTKGITDLSITFAGKRG
jgi:hypothetical protein